MIVYDSWEDAPQGDQWDGGEFFTPFELRCRGTGKLIYNPRSVRRLVAIRTRLSFPMVVTSAGRDPEYNARISSTGRDGPHTTGRAFDIQISGDRALKLIEAAVQSGFTGIGVNQKGPHAKRFIHLDDLPQDGAAPRPWIWSY